MEEEEEEAWEFGELEWVTGEVIIPGGGEESPAPLSDEAAASSRSPPESPSPPPPPPDNDDHQGHGSATAAAAAPPSSSSVTSNKRGRVPASSKAIQGLREVTATNESDDCCAICLQELDFQPETTAPLKLRAMPCSHTFHQSCIFGWLRRNAACPLCRQQLPTEEDDDKDKEQEQGRGRRRRMFRIVYDEDGLLCISNSSHRVFPVSDSDEEEEEELGPEQERMRSYLRAQYDRWQEMVARWHSDSRGVSEMPDQPGADQGTDNNGWGGSRAPPWFS